MIATVFLVEVRSISGSKPFWKVFLKTLNGSMRSWLNLDCWFLNLLRYIRSYERLLPIFWDVLPDCITIRQLDSNIWSSHSVINDHLANWVRLFWTHFVLIQSTIVSWRQWRIYVGNTLKSIWSQLMWRSRLLHHHVWSWISAPVGWMPQVCFSIVLYINLDHCIFIIIWIFRIYGRSRGCFRWSQFIGCLCQS